jgi:HicB-like protein involved in pilus formation
VQQGATAYDVSAVSSGAPAQERSQVAAVPSGRLLLRMPPDLHAELTRTAESEGKSLNAFITGRLAQSIGWGDAAHDGEPSRSRLLPMLLLANAVVVGVAAMAAVALLIFAWLG